MSEMSAGEKGLIKDACRMMTGFRKREYQAKITLEYFDDSARKAERAMGWGRQSVETGLG